MNFIKSLFFGQQKPQTQTTQPKQIESSLLNPHFYQVKLSDIKALSKDLKLLQKVLVEYQPQTINQELKRCYTLHVLLSSNQGDAIDKVVILFEENNIKPFTIQLTQARSLATINVNQTQIICSDQQMLTQFQNSMYINVQDQIQQFEQHQQQELEFINMYFNYIQRVTQNMDVYNSCKFVIYPSQTDERKLQFLWLFKVINLLNFKLTFVKYFQFQFQHRSQNSLIIRDIAYLVYKDCLMEYGFLRTQITNMLDDYSQFSIKEIITFYELMLFLQEITKKMKIFYDMRQQFALNTASVRDVIWFKVDRELYKEIENYAFKAKLLNTPLFKGSLMVPSQKLVMENLHKVIQDPSLMQNQDHYEPITAKSYKKRSQLYSPLNTNNYKKVDHSKQPSFRQQI